jgi:hypothetical protein
VPVEELLEEPALSGKAESRSRLEEDEERRSAGLAEEIEERNKWAIWRVEQVRKFLELSRKHLETMETVMKKNPDTDTVEALVWEADYMAVVGIGVHMDLNLDDREGEECEAAVRDLLLASMRMVEAQMAREKDEDKVIELRQLRHSLASKLAA